MIELAARAPDRVARAVLLDPAVWVPPAIALQRADDQRQDLSFANPSEAIAWRRGLSSLSPVELLEEEMDAHLAPGADGRLRLRYSPSAVVAAYGEMARQPPLGALAGLPTLIVRAPAAEVCPDEIVRLVHAAAPAVEVVDVPGGHIVMWDALEETAAAVAAFLAATEGSDLGVAVPG